MKPILGFSGVDAKAFISLPSYDGKNNASVYQLGTLQTISLSTYANKTPVKRLGQKDPSAIARGYRTYAGSLIFNQLSDNVLNDNWILGSPSKGGLISYLSGHPDPNKAKIHRWDYSDDIYKIGEYLSPNEVIPFDIVISFANEANGVEDTTQKGLIIIEGVDLTHDGQTISIEDIYTEQQYQYVARKIHAFKTEISPDHYSQLIRERELLKLPAVTDFNPKDF